MKRLFSPHLNWVDFVTVTTAGIEFFRAPSLIHVGLGIVVLLLGTVVSVLGKLKYGLID